MVHLVTSTEPAFIKLSGMIEFPKLKKPKWPTFEVEVWSVTSAFDAFPERRGSLP